MSKLSKCSRLVFSLAFVCTLTIALLGAKDSGNVHATTADDYAVYSVAMEDVVGGGSYVVLDTTTIHGKPEDLDSALNFPIEDAKLITADLLNDFRTKNHQSYAIAQHFPKGVRVQLISERERSVMFSGCMGEVNCGWKTFYEKYPGAPGITSLSRVGFNKAHDTALVYVGNVRDWEVGSGLYLLLAKNNGEWKVISRTRSWIS